MSERPSSLIDGGVIDPASMTESNTTLPLYKKNGALHWRKCAEFYGAKQGSTAREWYRVGAPVKEPEKMRIWLQAREDERLRKIAEGNMLYLPKEPEIIRLHVEEKLGTRAISTYFSGRPSSPGVRLILIRNGVYRGNEIYKRQIQDCEARKARQLQEIRKMRHRMALCLLRLRRGIGIETTCKQNGWIVASIRNGLNQRESYKRFKARQKPKWPDKRRYGNQYSRKFPRESAFRGVIEDILRKAGIRFEPESPLHGARTKVDIKLEDGTFVEFKVGLNSAQSHEFIGQATHYRKHAKKIILCIPSDVEVRGDLFELIVELGVIVCNETTIAAVLGGELPLVAFNQVVRHKDSHFICKCCGSAEKRRHRANSYCVECAPLIREMKFDYRSNRWTKLSE